MNGIDENAILWTLGAVHFSGLICGWVARLSAGARNQRACELLFYAALILVGVATIFSLAISPNSWLISSIAFAAMVLTTTCDFGGSRRAATA